MAWNYEDEQQLRRMWEEEDLSAGKIAKAMPQHTRNAIIGKARRMGLTRRESPIKRED